MSSLQEHRSDDYVLDRFFDVLSHRYRRWILMYMLVQDTDSIQVDTAVKLITRLEPYSSRDGVRTMLYHDHLRKMGRTDWIEFDPNAEVVVVRDFGLLEEVLDAVLQRDSRFSTAN